MPLARVKTWNPGDVLTAADLNAEFNNILNNPISLISNATSLVSGDILVASTAATPVLSRLAVGSPGQVISVTSSNTMPAWGGPLAGSRVSGLFGSFSSQIGSFTARQYIMQTTDGRQSFQVNATSSFSANVGTAGPAAGGRDVAGVFASTFVHFYAITTGVGSTAPAGLASTVPPVTGPTMPTNYSAWSYLGSMPYSSSSTTLLGGGGYINGSMTRFATPFSDGLVLSSGTSGAGTQVVFSSLVPTNAVNVEFLFLGIQTTAAAGTNLTANFHVTSSVGAAANSMHMIEVDAQVLSVEARSGRTPYMFPYLSASSQGLYYVTNSTALGITIFVSAYQNPNGGE